MSNVKETISTKKATLHTKSKRGALNVLFGRSTIIILALLLQILFLVAVFGHIGTYTPFVYGGSLALGLVMALYLINSSKEPSIRQTWLVLVMIFPVIGTLFYIYVETDIGHRLVRHRLGTIDRQTAAYFPRQEALMRAIQKKHPHLYNLTRYTQSCGHYPVYQNTSVEYFPLGEDKFEALVRELKKAEKFIFMEYFIIDEGYMWNTILDILTQKVKEGVEVRVMYDGTCAMYKLPYRYPAKLHALGIRCKMFSAIRPFVSTHYNNRDHRKIVVIDGHTAFTGGVNLADEYINQKVVHGHWKDTAIMLKGEAVRSFTLMFLQMWNVTESFENYRKYLLDTYPPVTNAGGYVLPYGDSPFDDDRVGEAIYLDIINTAKRYVHIMTPYLILDNGMVQALKYAAQRGIDVRLILPHIPDKKYAFSLAHTHYRELIGAGVKIFEYTPGFIHAKVFVSDDIKAVVGTINLDYRSLYLHFECAAYLYHVPCIAEIEADMRYTLRKCQQMTLDALKKDSLRMRLRGKLLKLFAPLM